MAHAEIRRRMAIADTRLARGYLASGWVRLRVRSRICSHEQPKDHELELLNVVHLGTTNPYRRPPSRLPEPLIRQPGGSQARSAEMAAARGRGCPERA